MLVFRRHIVGSRAAPIRVAIQERNGSLHLDRSTQRLRHTHEPLAAFRALRRFSKLSSRITSRFGCQAWLRH